MKVLSKYVLLIGVLYPEKNQTCCNFRRFGDFGCNYLMNASLKIKFNDKFNIILFLAMWDDWYKLFPPGRVVKRARTYDGLKNKNFL